MHEYIYVPYVVLIFLLSSGTGMTGSTNYQFCRSSLGGSGGTNKFSGFFQLQQHYTTPYMCKYSMNNLAYMNLFTYRVWWYNTVYTLKFTGCSQKWNGPGMGIVVTSFTLWIVRFPTKIYDTKIVGPQNLLCRLYKVTVSWFPPHVTLMRL